MKKCTCDATERGSYYHRATCNIEKILAIAQRKQKIRNYNRILNEGRTKGFNNGAEYGMSRALEIFKQEIIKQNIGVICISRDIFAANMEDAENKAKKRLGLK